MEKELRDIKIIDLHNQGESTRSIASSLKVSKSTVSNVVNLYLGLGEVPSKVVVDIKLSGKEDRFNSFVGYERVNVNEYAHKDSGEVVRVVFVKAVNPGEFGHFVKL
jgi:hypothetical protein